MSNPVSLKARYNIILLTLNVIYIFVIGLFENLVDTIYIYYVTISLIYIVSILAIKSNSNHFFYLPAIVILLTWASAFLDLTVLSQATGILSTLFFLFVIVLLVIRVARSKKVGLLEFIESVNVYLLLGIAASVLFRQVYLHNHDAYNPPGPVLQSHADFIYYSFVTMTTLGYGDITPISSIARSLSIFFSVTGQLYLAMIVAMLVGKYLSQKPMKEKTE